MDMTLQDAISWVEKICSLHLVYYVIPWNDGYCAYSETHMKRHPSLFDVSVYNTRDKNIGENLVVEELILIPKK